MTFLEKYAHSCLVSFKSLQSPNNVWNHQCWWPVTHSHLSLPADLTDLPPLTCSNLLHNISPIQNIVKWWSPDIFFARSCHFPSECVGNCSSTTSTSDQMKAKPIFPWVMSKEMETESRSSPDPNRVHKYIIIPYVVTEVVMLRNTEILKFLLPLLFENLVHLQ